MYAVIGPVAFAEKLHELERRIAGHRDDEFDRELLKLRALDMRILLARKLIEEGNDRDRQDA